MTPVPPELTATPATPVAAMVPPELVTLTTPVPDDDIPVPPVIVPLALFVILTPFDELTPKLVPDIFPVLLVIDTAPAVDATPTAPPMIVPALPRVTSNALTPAMFVPLMVAPTLLVTLSPVPALMPRSVPLTAPELLTESLLRTAIPIPPAPVPVTDAPV